MSERRGLSNLGLTVTLAVVGFAAGVAVLVADVLIDPNADAMSKAVVRAPGFYLWAIADGVLLALWLILLMPVFQHIKAVKGERTIPSKLWGLLALLLVAALLPSILLEPAGPLSHHALKLAFLTTAGVSVGIFALVGLWLIIGRLEHERESKLIGTAYIKELMHMRRQMNFFLGVLGVEIGTAILATGARRFAQISAYKAFPDVFEGTEWTADAFTIEFLLAYGAYYSVLLAIVYLPVHVRFNQVAGAFIDSYRPLPADPANADWSAWAADREAMGDTLQVGLIAPKAFVLAPIFAPFSGALISAIGFG